MKRLLAGEVAEEGFPGESPRRLALRVFRAGESTAGERNGDFLAAPRVFLAGESTSGRGDFLEPVVTNKCVSERKEAEVCQWNSLIKVVM